MSYSDGTSDIIKFLKDQEAEHVDAAITSNTNISEAMTILQNLELERDIRRGCNKFFVTRLQELKGMDKAFI